VITEGGHSNDLTLDAQAPTITVSGGQHLDIGGTAVDLGGPIVTFDASATTGGVHADFTGSGSATVIGGSGSDSFEFSGGAHDIHVSGGAGDDLFTFDENGSGGANFNSTDSADGGPGNDTLEIDAAHGAILLGGSIVNIETVRHDGSQSAELTADMSKMGSATTFQLDGSYNNGTDVVVNNLTDAQTVLFTGDQGNLFLHHAGLFGTDHLTMSAGFIGTTTLNTLHTDMEFGLTLQISSGPLAFNVINGVSDVNTDVKMTGGGNLTFGSEGNAYDFNNGVLDATATSGNVTVFLSNDGQKQTFESGSGNDTVNFLDFHQDQADFKGGGNDTANFFQVNNGGFNVDDTVNYLQVFNANANDNVTIDVDGGFFPPGFFNTTQAGAVAAGNATNTFVYAGGNVSATGAAFNFVELTTGVNTGSGVTADSAWTSAMGGGTIAVTSGTGFVVAAFYDLTHSQAVFVAVAANQNNPAAIEGTDGVDVVGMIHETQADFLASAGNHVAFV
jgi:fibronectin-binding autotransporter adhesin